MGSTMSTVCEQAENFGKPTQSLHSLLTFARRTEIVQQPEEEDYVICSKADMTRSICDLQRYDRIGRCSVCQHEDSCIVLFPCRHMTTCESCSEAVTNCPTCGSRIKGTVKIIL